MINNMDIPIEKISKFCEKWDVAEFALFGSVIREDFSSQSDIDVMVTFSPNAKRTLFHLGRMRAELSDILGRGVESGRNHIRKDEILRTAKTIYVA